MFIERLKIYYRGEEPPKASSILKVCRKLGMTPIFESSIEKLNGTCANVPISIEELESCFSFTPDVSGIFGVEDCEDGTAHIYVADPFDVWNAYCNCFFVRFEETEPFIIVPIRKTLLGVILEKMVKTQ